MAAPNEFPEMPTSSLGQPLEGTLAVGIDFGTTFSGVSYGSTNLFGGEIQTVLDWPGTNENYRKIPTCLVYAPVTNPAFGNVTYEPIKWGVEAKNHALADGEYRCEYFKLHLAPQGSRSAEHLPPLPPGKTANQVVSDFLSRLWIHCKEHITSKTGSVADITSATVVLTVPSSWNATGCALMRHAALKARVVTSANEADARFRDRLHIVTEPEAAAVHGVSVLTDAAFTPPNTFIVCDAGGGTVDCAAYKIAGRRKDGLELCEMTIRHGDNAGSLFLDQSYESLIREKLAPHPIHLDRESMQAMMESFVTVDKPFYAGTKDDRTSTYPCELYRTDHAHDPANNIYDGELLIDGEELATRVFDGTIAQAVDVVEEQLARLQGERVAAVLLVGGFSGSEYLYSELKRRLQGKISTILQPNDSDIATVQGAARYGLELLRGALSVTNVICPRSYFLETKMLATDDDVMRRPAYISTTATGHRVCDHRLDYLAIKGSIMKKGQKVTKKYNHRTETPSDSRFVANFKISDDAAVHRYSDECYSEDICSWTIDLAQYPAYCEHWGRFNRPGVVAFTIGLEFDSAEVRGSLMDDRGVCWGEITLSHPE